MFGELGVGHGVAAKTAFFGLDADVGHGFVGSAFDVAVGICGDTYYGALGYVKDIVVDLETASAG